MKDKEEDDSPDELSWNDLVMFDKKRREGRNFILQAIEELGSVDKPMIDKCIRWAQQENDSSALTELDTLSCMLQDEAATLCQLGETHDNRWKMFVALIIRKGWWTPP